MYTPTLLLILDGYGLAPAGPGNAVDRAHTPHIDSLYRQSGIAQLQCCGRDVGLPEGYMGNSEVGHLNIGAGRIVYQDMTRIDVALESGELTNHPVLAQLLADTRAKGGRLHLLGLLSDAGVHSHIAHLEALTDIAHAQQVPVRVQAFMDGRDTSPHAGEPFLERITAHLERTGAGRVGSLCGRFYAMDRDQRWERVQQAWDMLAHGTGATASDPLSAIKAAYAAGETDEFVKPCIIGDAHDSCIRDGDSVFFFNFRADRARELLRVFSAPDFDGFDRGRMPELTGLACMVPYDESLTAPVLFDKDNLLQTLGEVAASHGLHQLRIAETEKYAHVTYFFSGGREERFEGEDRIMVPSPKEVTTYDLKPSMSVYEVTERLIAAWNTGEYALVVCNLANPDMVGHTGNMQAVLEALEAVDQCVGQIMQAVVARHGRLLLTADHGNADEMIATDGTPSTSHSHNPVRLGVLEDGKLVPLKPAGRLADIAPTILHLWQIPQPPAMTGQSLVAD